MANFRVEKLYIRVAGGIDGFDPNAGIDAEEFAWLMICDEGSYERTPLRDFVFAPFDKPKWFSASKGLKVVRAFAAEVEALLEKSSPDERPNLEKKLDILRAVDDRLDMLDLKELKFHFLARDME